MKIAIVHELLIKLGGAERVAKIFSEMFPKAPIYTLLYDEKKCGQDFPKEKVKTAKINESYKFGVPLSFLRTKMPKAIESFNFNDYDLVISSSSAFAHGILTNTDTKHLCYCHSPMRYVWDYYHQVADQQAKKSIFGRLKKAMIYNYAHKLRMWDFVASARAEKIIANSKTVQRRIDKFWRKDANVIFPPVNTKRFTPTKTNEGYFLIVSALQPYKKIDIAIKAFNRIPKHKLIIIGAGDDLDYLKDIAGKNIEFLGRKSDSVVTEYIQNCRGFIFPGIEDFGITPVEAMASGKPVIAFNSAGLQESVVPEKTGVFFDEQNEDSLLNAMTYFFEIEKNFDYKKISAHAEQFSEENFKKAITAEIKSLMEQ